MPPEALPSPTSVRGPAEPGGLGAPLVSRADIATTVARMAAEIRAATGGRELTVVAVLHGALVFAADLIRALDVPVRLACVRARSYAGEATAPGPLHADLQGLGSVAGRHVLLVDDILDTGRTLALLAGEIAARGPASLHTAVLLHKPSRRLTDVAADFVGLTIPDVFVVGYGLDHDGRWRNLPDVHVLPGPDAAR